MDNCDSKTAWLLCLTILIIIVTCTPYYVLVVSIYFINVISGTNVILILLLQDSSTPLHLADLEVAKLLVSHGADLEVRNKVGVNMISLRVCDGYVQDFFCVLGTVYGFSVLDQFNTVCVMNVNCIHISCFVQLLQAVIARHRK